MLINEYTYIDPSPKHRQPFHPKLNTIVEENEDASQIGGGELIIITVETFKGMATGKHIFDIKGKGKTETIKYLGMFEFYSPEQKIGENVYNPILKASASKPYEIQPGDKLYITEKTTVPCIRCIIHNGITGESVLTGGKRKHKKTSKITRRRSRRSIKQKTK